MGNIFNKKPKETSVRAVAPEEDESSEEKKHIEELDNNNEKKEAVVEPTKKVEEASPAMNYREIPVCMSQSQINNLVIENNIMLKQVMASMD